MSNPIDMIEGVQPYERIYIGNVEAWEICLERGIDKLPRKGKEIVTVKSIAEMQALGLTYHEVIGKDGNGFYLTRI